MLILKTSLKFGLTHFAFDCRAQDSGVRKCFFFVFDSGLLEAEAAIEEFLTQ